jgi:hypothetical protein
MAKAITLSLLRSTGESSFEARGECDGKAFLARTITYRGEPIFKVQESGADGALSHLRMADSTFDRGERIAIARFLKAAREAEAFTAEPVVSDLSVKELRARCREAGITGHSAKGVRKSDLVALIEACPPVDEAATATSAA